MSGYVVVKVFEAESERALWQGHAPERIPDGSSLERGLEMLEADGLELISATPVFLGKGGAGEMLFAQVALILRHA